MPSDVASARDDDRGGGAGGPREGWDEVADQEPPRPTDASPEGQDVTPTVAPGHIGHAVRAIGSSGG